MLSPVEFVALWGADQLVTFPPRAVDRLPLAAEDKAFLVAAGLPTDAAPFLSFNAPAATELPTVAEQWGVAVDLGRYRVIGSDGSGNPIVFDEQSGGQVLRLDHENGFASALINSTVRQLAESLFAYRKLVKATQAEFGPDAFLDGKTSAAARQTLQEELTKIDPAAVQAGSFWYGELQLLEANASSTMLDGQ